MSQDAIQQMLKQMREGFLGELPERLDLMESLLLAMEGGVEADEAFRGTFRLIHSIKGSGGTHGFHILTTICHAFEDALQSRVSNGVMAPGGVDLCLGYLDLLRTTTWDLENGLEDFSPVLAHLGALQEVAHPKLQRVMLLEPSRLSVSIYAHGLQGLPLDLVPMGDGYHALLRLLKEPFRLLITANELDFLNGPALLSALRLSNSVNVDIKAILITSSQVKGRGHGWKTDADLVLVKNRRISSNLRQGVMGLLGIEEA